jgi:hypothetical protein
MQHTLTRRQALINRNNGHWQRADDEEQASVPLISPIIYLTLILPYAQGRLKSWHRDPVTHMVYVEYYSWVRYQWREMELVDRICWLIIVIGLIVLIVLLIKIYCLKVMGCPC